MNHLEILQQKLKRDIILSNGLTVIENIPEEHTQCPSCGRLYKFSKPRGQGEPWEKEQHITGYCSDKCWPLK